MDKDLLKETYDKIRKCEFDNEKLRINLQAVEKKLKEKELEFEKYIEIVKNEKQERNESLEKRNLLVNLLERELLLKTRKIEELERKIKGD